MIRAQLFKDLRQLKSDRKLSKVLAESNHAWAKELGFARAPHHDSFSAFRKRAGSQKYVEIFNGLLSKWKSVLTSQGKEVGREIAVDSTGIKAYARSRRGKRCSDPDAKWGYATDPQTGKETRIFGWKLHTLLDINYGCPLAFRVTGADRADTKEFPRFVREAKAAEFPVAAIIADAGYDARSNYFITMKHKAAPIIKYNRRGAPKGTKGHKFDYLFPIPRGSKAWNDLYRKRTAVERQFSELKEQLGIKHLTLRRLEGATIHFALSLTVLVAINLVAHLTGNPELLRSIEPWRYL